MTKPGLPPEERFWSKVRGGDVDACWTWAAAIMPLGYGAFNVGNGRIVLAHRWAYENMRGPIPDGLQLDHLCRARACVNPWHLEPVTAAENKRRGNSPAATAARRGGCPCGREYDIVRSGSRRCRECDNARERERYARRKAEGLVRG